jgi:hypothetical protein
MMAEKPFQIKIDDDVLQKIIKQVANENVKERIIHDGVEYGVFQEFSIAAGGRRQTTPGGRRGMTSEGHPSLMPAFERHTKDLPKLIGQAIERAVPLDRIMAKIAFDIMRDWAADVNVDTGAYRNSITVSEG